MFSLTKNFVKINRSNKLIHLQTSLSSEEKTEKLKDITRNRGKNGIGDAEAVSQVLKSIGISNKLTNDNGTVIEQKVTKNILNTMSNLVDSDMKISKDREETQSASKIGDRYGKLLLVFSMFHSLLCS